MLTAKEFAALKTQRLSRGATTTIVGDTFSTTVPVTPVTAVYEAQNYGVSVFKVLGDGRIYLPIQTLTPSALSPGEVWLEDVGGVTKIKYRASDGTTTTVGNGGTFDASAIVSGTIDPARLPAVSLTTIQVVADQAARLAVTAQPGDAVKQLDTGESYILMSDPATVNGNWVLVSDISPDWSAVSNKPTTLAGYGITDAQPLNSVLTALTTAGNGIVVKSGTNILNRTITGTTGQITVTNGDGLSANPTISLPSTITQATTFSQELSLSQSLLFTPITAPTGVAGRVWYDTDRSALTYYNGLANVHIGQESIVQVRNSTGAAIAAGLAVYVSGALGSQALISLASNTTYVASQTIGLTSTSIANNGQSYIVTQGICHNIDTSAYTDGDVLWLGTGGTLTNTRPSDPTRQVRVGYVIYSHAVQGRILVAIQSMDLLDGLSDVTITSPSLNHVLAYNGSKWVNQAPSQIFCVDDYGAVGDGVTDDTAAVNACIAATPAGGMVQFTGSKTYYLRSLSDITKTLVIDGQGAKIVCDVTNSGAAGTPLFPFQGNVTATYAAAAVTIGSSTVSLSVGGTGANFAVGDVIRLAGSTNQPQWWDGTAGPMAAQSLYQVIAVVGDTLTISPPAHMLYTSSVSVAKLNLIANPTIRNFSNISEVYAGTAGSVVSPSPDIISFRYCRNSLVENVVIDGFGCEAVKLQYVYGGSILSVTAKNAFNPQVGGIGNLCQISFSRYVTTRNCIGYNVRHGIDYDVSQDCVSYGNIGSSSTNDVTASIYTTHGSGCCRITSIGDSAEGESGWWVGRAAQSVDTDISIIGFKFVATPTAYSAVIVTGGSSRVNISNCNLRYAGPFSGGVAAIRLENGAKDVTIDNCTVDLSQVSGTPTGTPAVNVITNVISSTTYYCSGVTVRNSLLSVPSGQIVMQLEGTGAFEIRGCIISGGIGIYGFNAASVPQSVTIDNNRFTLLGTPLSAIRLGSGGATSGPTAVLSICDNQIAGSFSSSAILAHMASTPASGVRVTGNICTVAGTVVATVTSNVGAYVDSGARIEWNSTSDIQRLNSDVRVYGTAGTARGFSFYTGSSLRAKLGLTTVSESGGNAGSDFALSTYDDTGTLVDTPFTIERGSAGFIRFPRANTLFGSSTTANVYFEVRSQVNTLSTFQFSAGSIARWAIRKDNNTESGSDVGANFNIVAYSDTGSQIDTPFVINRQLSGAIYLQRTQLVVSGSTATSATVDIRTAAGSAGQVQLCSAALGRWRLMKNNVAETGSDVGSDFEIKASTDAGATIDSPLYITRAAQGAFKVARPVTIIPSAATTGSPYALRVTVPAHTTLTAAEAISVDLLLGATVQFSTGNFGTQRAVRIQAPTYAFVAASTITTASTVSIAGAPIAGTNATFTNAYALNIESGNINLVSGSLLLAGTDIFARANTWTAAQTASLAAAGAGLTSVCTLSTGTIRNALRNDASRELWILYSGSTYASSAFGQTGEFGLLGTVGAFPLHLGTNSTRAITIDSSQNIGIGGTPFDKLDVYGSATIRGSTNFYASSSTLFNSSNAYTAINVSAGGSLGSPTVGLALTVNTSVAELRTTTNHPIVFMPNSVERMRLDTSGNLGIGVTPVYKLDVSGNIQSGYNHTATPSGATLNTIAANQSWTPPSAGTGNGAAFGLNSTTVVNGQFATGLNTIGISVYAGWANSHAGDTSTGTHYAISGQALVNNQSAGTMVVPQLTSFYGTTRPISSTGAGVTTINNAMVFYANITNALAAGTTAVIGNYYGIYLDSPSSSTGLTINNRYGVYQADSAASNYFAGNVIVGAASALGKVTIGQATNVSTGNDIYIDSTSNVAAGIKIRNANYSAASVAFIGVDSLGGFTIAKNGTDQFYMGRNGGTDNVFAIGNLGIGVTPTQKLDVALSNNGANPGTSGTAQTGGIGRFRHGNATIDVGGYSAGGGWIQSTDVTNLAVQYDLTLQPNGGNVSIGVTPTSGFGVVQAYNAATPDINKTTMALSGTTSAANPYAGIRLTHNVFTTGWGADISAIDAGTFGTDLRFRVTPTGSANTTTPVEVVRITSGGNLNIVTGQLQFAGTDIFARANIWTASNIFGAGATASDAAPSMGSATLRVQPSSGLGSTLGDRVNALQYSVGNSNTGYLRIFERRYVAGTVWTSASARIQRTIDASEQDYIDFRGSLSYGGNTAIVFGNGTSTDTFVFTSAGNLYTLGGAAWSNGGMSAEPTGKHLSIGYDTTNSIGYVRSSNNGVAYTELRLAGSSVTIHTGSGTAALAATFDINGGLTTAGGRFYKQRTIVTSGAIQSLDATDHVVYFSGSTTHTVTLPAASAGRVIILIRATTTGTISMSRYGSDTINGGTSATLGSPQVSRMYVAVGADWVTVASF